MNNFLRLVIALDYAHQLAPGGHVGFLKADIELRHKDDHSNHGSLYTLKGVRQKYLQNLLLGIQVTMIE